METTDFLKTVNNMRRIVVATIACFTVVVIIFGFMLLKVSNDNERNVYVVSDAGTFLAKRNDYGLRYDFEIKNHVRIFFQNLFEGDQFTFTKNIESALCLIDNASGQKLYEQVQKGGLYDLYKRDNAHSRVTVDSIKVDMDVKPYKARIWLKQAIYWAGYSREVPYAAEMDVVEDNRSEKNPFGMLITNFFFIKTNLQMKTRSPNDSIR